MRIPPLDAIGVVPQRGTLYVLVAVTGRGKTWFLVHCGARALSMRWRVAHVSLEIDAPDVLGRYYQTLWQASEHAEETSVTELDVEKDRLKGLSKRMVPPRFAFRDVDNIVDPELATELELHMQHMGAGRDYLRVKAWPPHKVGIEQIEAYLDILADEHWHPDVLLVDYPKLFKFRSAETLRIELGYAVEDLRRIAQERNMAVVMVHQSNRKGASAQQVGLTHISEDWSIVQTADFVLSYSATESEEKYGLGRLHVDKARGPRNKGQTILITQNYAIGQFARQAYLMPDNYTAYMESQQAAQPAEEEVEEGTLFDERKAAACLMAVVIEVASWSAAS